MTEHEKLDLENEAKKAQLPRHCEEKEEVINKSNSS